MDIVDIRRKNLNTLIEQLADDNVTRFAEKYGYSRSQIYQFLSKTYNNGRSMGERAAREMERRVGWAEGWLDRPLTSLVEMLNQAEAENAGSENGTTDAIKEHPGIPVYGNVSTDHQGMIVDTAPFRNVYTDTWLPIQFKGKDLFAVRLIGTALNPRIKSGEYLIVDRHSPPRHGDDVLIKLVSGERYILQFLYVRNNEMVFGPLNNPTPSLSVAEKLVFSAYRILMILDEEEEE
jgi:SOS-response transcriptional repressor LexA